MTILEWIKANAKEGANIAEAEELVQNSTFDGITTKEQALEFIGKNAAFTSATDSLISTAVQNHDDKFKAEKLPGLIAEEREKLTKELNPDETPEQKRIRELEDKIKASDKTVADNALKSTLRAKAKELGYDTSLAEELSVFGDNAIEALERRATSYSEALKSGIETEVKSRLAGKPPGGGETTITAKTKTRAEFDALDAVSQREFIKSGGVPVD